MIDELIDKQDSFEIIRDQIGMILVNEVANQMALATAAAKDPEDWNLQIFTERTNPYEKWLNVEGKDKSELVPIVNVWYDNSSFELSGSNIMERQQTVGIFNIDCYGYGVSENVDGGGHIPGDEASALEVQKALRLVRNILMAAENTYLQLRGLVWQRWPQSVTVFQQQLDAQNVQQTTGARMAFRVTFNELSPQVSFETLEIVSLEVFRAEDGQLIAETDYEYPL